MSPIPGGLREQGGELGDEKGRGKRRKKTQTHETTVLGPGAPEKSLCEDDLSLKCSEDSGHAGLQPWNAPSSHRLAG